MWWHSKNLYKIALIKRTHENEILLNANFDLIAVRNAK